MMEDSRVGPGPTEPASGVSLAAHTPETWHERFLRLGAGRDYAGCLAMMREPLAPNWSSPDYTIVPLTKAMARAQADVWHESEARVSELLGLLRRYSAIFPESLVDPSLGNEARAAIAKALGSSTQDTTDGQVSPRRPK